MTQKSKIFPESKELKELIESHDWSLYDATIPKGRAIAFSWEEFDEMKPAEEFEMGHNYIFVPRPHNGETLRQAYSVTKGLGPFIRLDSIDQHVNMDGDGGIIFQSLKKDEKNKLILKETINYYFTRLFFDEYRGRKAVIATSLHQNSELVLPALAIPFEHVLDKFKQHFYIITPEEFNKIIHTSSNMVTYSGMN
jgi:hypothetical protein